jgi:hypothetical protein
MSAMTMAYLRTTMREHRRKVMADWAAFLAGESDEAKVVPFEGKRRLRSAAQEGSA